MNCALCGKKIRVLKWDWEGRQYHKKCNTEKLKDFVRNQTLISGCEFFIGNPTQNIIY